MPRYKILGVCSIFTLALFALFMSIKTNATTSGSEEAFSEDKSARTIADQKFVQRYKWKQQELRLAIKAYFDKAIASGQIVGAGVSIVKGDSIVISDGFGKRNINIDAGVDGQTVFRLGSLSKGFTGILAANLENEGKIDWEAKVSDYIPEFQLGDPNNTSKITLANILSHTSGAPYHSYTNLVEAGLPLTEIAKRFKDVDPISDPGVTYSYQNALFALSGEMMFKATGEDINTSLKDRFFKPLEMCSTTMDYETLAKTENIAIPHSKRRNSWRSKKLNDNYYNAIAAGGINASADDMARWMRFLLGHNPEIMSKQEIEEAFNPAIEIKGHYKYYQRWPGHQASYYGYGWRIHKFVEDQTGQEKTIWHHGGSVNNFRNEIAVYPESDLGICVLLNNNSRLARTVVPDLYKIIKKVYDQSATRIAFNGVPNNMLHL